MKREISTIAKLTIDLEAYINSYNTFGTVEESDKNLISALLNAPKEYYNNDTNLLVEIVGAIKAWNKQKNIEQLLKTIVLKEENSAYNNNEKCLKCRELDAKLDEIKIPKAYFYMGLLFLIAFFVFSTLIFVQLIYKMQIIPIYYLIMLWVASGGMVATVVAATIDWKRLKEGKRNR